MHAWLVGRAANPCLLCSEFARFDSGAQLDVVYGLLAQVGLSRAIERSQLVGGAEAVVENVEGGDTRDVLGVAAVVPDAQPHGAVVVRIVTISSIGWSGGRRRRWRWQRGQRQPWRRRGNKEREWWGVALGVLGNGRAAAGRLEADRDSMRELRESRTRVRMETLEVGKLMAGKLCTTGKMQGTSVCFVRRKLRHGTVIRSRTSRLCLNLDFGWSGVEYKLYTGTMLW